MVFMVFPYSCLQLPSNVVGPAQAAAGSSGVLNLDALVAREPKLTKLLRHLDERQRRLLAAAEARALGYGGVAQVARACGLSRPTIHKALAELEEAPLPAERVRRAGGGRKKTRDLEPALLQALERLIDPVTRGDPTSPLRWTCKSTRHLADALAALGYTVSQEPACILSRSNDSVASFVSRASGAPVASRSSTPRASSVATCSSTSTARTERSRSDAASGWRSRSNRRSMRRRVSRDGVLPNALRRAGSATAWARSSSWAAFCSLPVWLSGAVTAGTLLVVRRVCAFESPG